ncbi:MAG: hypothetical protein ABI197_00240 [Granulicella sp.]
MNYVLDLFTPETWKAFRDHGADVTGFSAGHFSRARNLVRPGDIFVCYLVRLSRWCGLLEVTSELYKDDTPIFRPTDDPWTTRFRVRPLVLLNEDKAIPIRLPEIWNGFSRTRPLQQNSQSWPVKAVLQSSLAKLSCEDGQFLAWALRRQSTEQITYPLSERDQKIVENATDTVKSPGRIVTVVVPESSELEQGLDAVPHVLEESRESIKKQALLVEIGAKMGFDIWVPRSDQARIERELSAEAKEAILKELPLNFDRVTFKTIENIDVLWLKKRTLVRAFEVEHTTAIYSGLLRMADLLALQPNIDIKLHIVAPEHRRDKVLDEIQRPVFALLDKGPLANSCTFISYDALEELRRQDHLAHMSDSVLEDYEEAAPDLDKT